MQVFNSAIFAMNISLSSGDYNIFDFSYYICSFCLLPSQKVSWQARYWVQAGGIACNICLHTQEQLMYISCGCFKIQHVGTSLGRPKMKLESYLCKEVNLEADINLFVSLHVKFPLTFSAEVKVLFLSWGPVNCSYFCFSAYLIISCGHGEGHNMKNCVSKINVTWMFLPAHDSTFP